MLSTTITNPDTGTNMKFARRRGGMIAALLAGTMMLAACGGGGESTEAESAGASSEASDNTPAPDNGINAFSFTATGDAASMPTQAGLSMTGGCDGNSQMNYGFRKGDLSTDDYFYVSFTTTDVVATGATGEYTLTEIVWDNGLMAPADLPTDANVKIPVRYEGDGLITIKTHDASINNRRVVATVSGSVTSAGRDDMQDISYTFDINMSCGVH